MRRLRQAGQTAFEPKNHVHSFFPEAWGSIVWTQGARGFSRTTWTSGATRARLDSVDRTTNRDRVRVGADLEIARAGAPVSLALGSLTRIRGRLAIQQAGEVRIAADRLLSIGGDLRVADATVTALDVPALERIGGSLRLERFGSDVASGGAPERSFSFPALAELGGDLQIRAGARTRLALPALRIVDGGVTAADVELGLLAPRLERIAGGLRVLRATLEAPALEALQSLGGDLSLTALTMVARPEWTFPALAQVEGAVEVSEIRGLDVLAFPALARVSGRVRLERAAFLARVAFDALPELPNDLAIEGCMGPLEVSLPRAQAIGRSLVLRDIGEVSLRLPALTSIKTSVRVERVTFRAWELPRLERVVEDLEVMSVSLRGVSAFQAARLATVGGNLALERAEWLKIVDLPSLTAVGNLSVRDNPWLEILAAPALRTVKRDVVVRGNAALPSPVVYNAVAGVSVAGRREICANQDGLPACP